MKIHLYFLYKYTKVLAKHVLILKIKVYKKIGKSNKILGRIHRINYQIQSKLKNKIICQIK